MNELTNEVTEEMDIRELTVDELESVNGGAKKGEQQVEE